MELDDFDSPADEEGPNPFKEQKEREAMGDDGEDGDRLSDSPVEITQSSFMHGTESIHIPTPSPYEQGEGGDEDDDDDEGPESLTSSPSIIEHPGRTSGRRRCTRRQRPNAHSTALPRTLLTRQRAIPSRATNRPTAAPHPLPPRTYLLQYPSRNNPGATAVSALGWKTGSEVKDMMVMIHDKSGVVPVSDDHPMMAGLFTEQRKGVQDMMGQLDGLLGSYLQRKGIALG